MTGMWWALLIQQSIITLLVVAYVRLLDRRDRVPRVIGKDVQVPRAVAIPASWRRKRADVFDVKGRK